MIRVMLVEQATRRDLQRPSQPRNYLNCRVAAPAFDVAYIGAVYASAVGVILLAPAIRFAKPPYVLAKARTDFHAGAKTRLSPIDLQTISVIRLDFIRPPSVCVVSDRLQENGDEGCQDARTAGDY